MPSSEHETTSPEQSTAREPSSENVIVDHVGMLVSDIDAGIAFFTGVGLEVLRRQRIPDAAVETVYLGGGSGGVIQLLEPDADSPLRAQVDQGGEGLHHICLATDDMDALARTIPGEGPLRIIRGGRDKWTCFLSQKQFGAFIELAQATRPASLGPEA
jgi:catechol 2,3-dioxygenase-like lactoylglutathione lyase family enzyme